MNTTTTAVHDTPEHTETPSSQTIAPQLIGPQLERSKPLRVFVVAGEPSGDVLGAAVLKELKAQGLVTVSGIGGPLMEDAGQFASLVPLDTLSVVGFDILWRLPRLWRTLQETRAQIAAMKPDVLLTIDAQELAVRLAKTAPAETRKIHIAAPEVWAWRPGRAKTWAKTFDHLCALYPFEPPFFTKHGLPTTFVGHPKADLPPSDTDAFWKAHPNLTPDKPLLLLMPGSRTSERQALWPLFRGVAQQAATVHKGLQVAVMLAAGVTPKDLPAAETWLYVQDKADQRGAMHAATAALVASGTATLELGLAGCPMVVAYRVNVLLGALLRLVVSTRFVSLPNILLNKPLVPECLQRTCNERTLLQETLRLLQKGSAYTAQKESLASLRGLFHPKTSPHNGPNLRRAKDSRPTSFGARVADVVVAQTS